MTALSSMVSVVKLQAWFIGIYTEFCWVTTLPVLGSSVMLAQSPGTVAEV